MVQDGKTAYDTAVSAGQIVTVELFQNITQVGCILSNEGYMPY